MTETNYYLDIKQSIEKHFAFLKEYNFSSFNERQVSYEYHFECSNCFVSIDIWFELSPSSPLWVHIGGYYIQTIEPDNLTIEALNKQRSNLYDDLFKQYLQTSKKSWLKKISAKYAVYGRELNDQYLEEFSNILKRNDFVLSGDLQKLERAKIDLQAKVEKEEREKKINDEIYTCRFNVLNGAEAEYEAASLYEIKNYLESFDRDSISDVKVYNGQMQLIEFSVA